MIGRVVEIAEDGRHLAKSRGFLTVSAQGAEIGRVPLDDVAAVVASAHGINRNLSGSFTGSLTSIAAEASRANLQPIAFSLGVLAHGRCGVSKAEMSRGRFASMRSCCQ